MTECCTTCEYKCKIEKLDFSQRGCVHSYPDGYACTVFVNDGVILWSVGRNSDRGMCELYEESDKEKI